MIQKFEDLIVKDKCIKFILNYVIVCNFKEEPILYKLSLFSINWLSF